MGWRGRRGSPNQDPHQLDSGSDLRHAEAGKGVLLLRQYHNIEVEDDVTAYGV